MEGESRTIVSKLVVGGDQIMGHSMSEDILCQPGRDILCHTPLTVPIGF